MPKTLPLVAYADELVEKLRGLVPMAIKDADATAVHQARVTTRRLKSALDVFEPILTRAHRKEFAAILKKLRRNLGSVRDLDVMLGHLKNLKNPATNWAIEKMNGQQADLRKTAAKKIDLTKTMAKLGTWWGVRQELVEAGDDLQILIAESLNLQLDLFIAHADGITGKRGPDAPPQLIDPHQLRIAGKQLRYTLELAVAGGHRLPPAVGRSFKKMQEALGLWHDYVVLSDHLLKLSLDAALGHHDADLQIAVLNVAKATVGRSKKQLAVFNKLWGQRGEQLAQTIRHAFPLTQQVSAPKMDLDPPGSASLADNLEAPAADETSAA